MRHARAALRAAGSRQQEAEEHGYGSEKSFRDLTPGLSGALARSGRTLSGREKSLFREDMTGNWWKTWQMPQLQRGIIAREPAETLVIVRPGTDLKYASDKRLASAQVARMRVVACVARTCERPQSAAPTRLEFIECRWRTSDPLL